MKVLIQRVNKASVTIEDKLVGIIGEGLLIYVCFEIDDTHEVLDRAIKKITNLRIFSDIEDKMNTNILQMNGAVLSVSQFTLSWDGKKGHRPSFDKSLSPNQAKILYRNFNDKLKNAGVKVEKGIYGADMKFSSINDGPVTFMLNF
jgi:D-tyrosyl-tRNA(Tyr) deacylase